MARASVSVDMTIFPSDSVFDTIYSRESRVHVKGKNLRHIISDTDSYEQ